MPRALTLVVADGSDAWPGGPAGGQPGQASASEWRIGPGHNQIDLFGTGEITMSAWPNWRQIGGYGVPLSGQGRSRNVARLREPAARCRRLSTAWVPKKT